MIQAEKRNNILVVSGIVLLIYLFFYSSLHQRLSVLSTDFLLMLRHHVTGQQRPVIESDTVVIAFDELTYRTEPFAKLPKVLWTPMLAKVQDSVLQAGAKVVGYDIIFPTSLESYIPGHEKPFLVSLMKAARKKQLVLGKAQHSDTPVAPHASQAFLVKTANIRSLNMKVDVDDVIRRIPVQFATPDNGFENSMALELASRATGKPVSRNDNGKVFLGDYEIPGSQSNGAIINFQGGADIPTYSLADMYACAQADNSGFFKKHFAGKVVMIGGVLDIEDRKQTSKRWMTESGTAAYVETCHEDAITAKPGKIERDSIPGVFVTASAVNNFINRDFLKKAPEVTVEAALLLSALTMAVAGLLLKPVLATVFMLITIKLSLIAGISLLHYNLLIPVLSFITAIIISYGLTLIYRYLYLDKQKSLIRNLFSLYLEPQLVDDMVKSEKLPSLGGEERQITAWFADLADFTKISEGLTPNELVSLMNVYFAAVTEIIEAHGGFVAQYVGDEVYAVFGAPFEDEYMQGHAVAAALTVKHRLNQMNASDAFGGKQIVARIGINSGPATVGNVGSKRRLNYAIMGDTVNLGSRLEGANKITKTDILISDTVAAKLPDSFILRELATIRVKGKKKPTTVFEPVYMKSKRSYAHSVSKHRKQDDPVEISFGQTLAQAQQLSGDFARAQVYFREGDFNMAMRALSAYADDDVAKVIIERARALLEDPPESWDGVITLTEK